MQLNCNCCFADDPAQHSVGADGERSRQRRRSATDAAYPLRVHIGPRSMYHLMEICGEFVGSQRADVGIGPYKVQYMNKTGRVFRK